MEKQNTEDNTILQGDIFENSENNNLNSNKAITDSGNNLGCSENICDAVNHLDSNENIGNIENHLDSLRNKLSENKLICNFNSIKNIAKNNDIIPDDKLDTNNVETSTKNNGYNYDLLKNDVFCKRPLANSAIKLGLNIAYSLYLNMGKKQKIKDYQSSINNFEKHLSSFNWKTELHCSVCSFKAKFLSHLINHEMLPHKIGNKYICTNCKETFYNINIYQTHMKDLHNCGLKFKYVFYYFCKTCSYATKTKKCYDIHVSKCKESMLHVMSIDIPHISNNSNTVVEEVSNSKLSNATKIDTSSNVVRPSLGGPLLQLPANAKAVFTHSGEPLKYEINKIIYQLIKSTTNNNYVLSPIEKSKEVSPRPSNSNSIVKQILNIKPNIPQKSLKYKCEECFHFFDNKQAFFHHLEIVHFNKVPSTLTVMTKPPYACDFCSNRYWMVPSLLKHRRQCHIQYSNDINLPNGMPESNLKTLPVNEMLKLPNISKPIKNGKSVMNNLNKNKQYSCYICEEKVLLIAKHMSLKHKIDLKKMFETKTCMVCGLRFHENQILETHILAYHSELFQKKTNKTNSPKHIPKPFNYKTMCDLCNGYFGKKSFKNHLMKKHKACPYKWCGKYFNDELTVKMHLKVFHTCIVYVCPICKYKFESAKENVDHLKSHLKKLSIKLERINPNDFKVSTKEPPNKKIKLENDSPPNTLLKILDDLEKVIDR